MTHEPYDWALDAYRSWQLAIAEKRKAGLLSGQFQPRNDDERDYLEQMRSGPE